MRHRPPIARTGLLTGVRLGALVLGDLGPRVTACARLGSHFLFLDDWTRRGMGHRAAVARTRLPTLVGDGAGGFRDLDARIRGGT